MGKKFNVHLTLHSHIDRCCRRSLSLSAVPRGCWISRSSAVCATFISVDFELREASIATRRTVVDCRPFALAHLRSFFHGRMTTDRHNRSHWPTFAFARIVDQRSSPRARAIAVSLHTTVFHQRAGYDSSLWRIHYSISV